MIFSPEAVLAAGLGFAGYSVSDRLRAGPAYNSFLFRRTFGVGEAAVAALFDDLENDPSVDVDYRIIFESIYWMKDYGTREQLKPLYDKNVTYIGRDVAVGVQQILTQFPRKIYWGDFNPNNPFPVTHDGVHFCRYESRIDPGSKWYSHKKNGPGVGFGFALSTEQDRCVHVSGWHYPSMHDITIFRGGVKGNEANWDPNAVYALLSPGAKAIGDSGYTGEKKCMTARIGHCPELAEFIKRAKARQESFHSRLESFGALNQTFRHDVEMQSAVVRAAVVLVQYDMENGHPLMQL